MKRVRADDLIRRLRERFAPGGLLHYGQGKWYPGEPLPRWAFSLYWRRDGVPIWRDENLIAREAADHKPTADDSQRFAEGIAARVGITADYVQPAYEDPADRMLKQGLIPENIDPSDPKIDDPRERARILSLFDGHAGKPAGFVLPLQRWTAQAKPGWLSEVWQTRRGRLFLMPGRFAARFSPAAAIVARCRPGRLSASSTGRPVRRTHTAARSSRHSSDRGQRLPDCDWRRGFAAARPRDFDHPATPPAQKRRARRLRYAGAHSSGRRGARRPVVRVHAAGRDARRLSRSARGRRNDGRRARHCRCTSKATRHRPIRGSTSSK